MPELYVYKLFISHAWGYNESYYRLYNMLVQAPNFRFANYSVPKHDPVDAGNKTKLGEELRQQIRPVNVVLILGGMYVNYSEWIQFEIDYADYLGKPIIGIRPWNAQLMPNAVQNISKEVVGWSTSNIVSAIRRWA